MGFQLVVRPTQEDEWVPVIDNGGSSVIPPPAFQFGVDKPTAENSGVPDGLVLGDWDGGSNIPANTHLDGVRFPNIVSSVGENVTIEKSLFEGVPSQLGGPNTGGVLRFTNANVRNNVLSQCTVRPATGSNASIGIVGHDFEAYRCDVSGVVDPFRIFTNSTANPDGFVNVKLWGNFGHDLSYYTPFAGHEDNQTHNDGVQIEGGKGIDIFGNAFSARADPAAGFGQGPGATQYPPYALSAIMVTPNVSKVDGLRIRMNWLDGGYYTLNIDQKALGPILELDLEGNRFSGQRGAADIGVTRATYDINVQNWLNNIREDTQGQPSLVFG